MDFWRSAKSSRLEKNRNIEIRRIIEMEKINDKKIEVLQKCKLDINRCVER